MGKQEPTLAGTSGLARVFGHIRTFPVAIPLQGPAPWKYGNTLSGLA
ncbi:hypothetical protein ARTHRO9AX_210214 [Arthrobacter sp. 9AX]|nr:hypothetical protein ARTHRO9AX_210214 [Arthrobacter sp. 9AX]